MLHHHYVGHFDPSEPVDTTSRPYQPKIQRPIVHKTVEELLKSFAPDVADYINWCAEGYVICNWSLAPRRLWDRVHQFAYDLAESEGAVVMREGYIVEYPLAARKVWQEAWADKLD